MIPFLICARLQTRTWYPLLQASSQRLMSTPSQKAERSNKPQIQFRSLGQMGLSSTLSLNRLQKRKDYPFRSLEIRQSVGVHYKAVTSRTRTGGIQDQAPFPSSPLPGSSHLLRLLMMASCFTGSMGSYPTPSTPFCNLYCSLVSLQPEEDPSMPSRPGTLSTTMCITQALPRSNLVKALLVI